ncbi:LCP family protein, partial [Pseudomonas aeruginosa]|nr:LCP family protein [Pseudomonas aeruginosa]
IKEMNKYIKDTQKNIGGPKKKIKKAGKQTLNGNQAVTYARIRKDSADGDHRRNERMKIVLSAAFEKAKTLSLSQLNQIADKILPTIKTNMSTNQ